MIMKRNMEKDREKMILSIIRRYPTWGDRRVAMESTRMGYPASHFKVLQIRG